MLARLRGLAEGGALVPLPWLRAAALGPPPALLNDLRAPYLPPDKLPLLRNLVSAAQQSRTRQCRAYTRGLELASAGRHDVLACCLRWPSAVSDRRLITRGHIPLPRSS